MKRKILLGLALFLCGVLPGCTTPANRPAVSVPPAQIQTEDRVGQTLQKILKRIEPHLPELAAVGISTGTSSQAEVWKGEEYAAGGFFLAKDPRPLSGYPGHFMEDIAVTIHRYASSGDEEQDVEKSLFRDRQERPATKEKYKGADLYRWRSGGGQVVCQDGLYVIEITPFREGASPVVMKVLDVVLAELNSTSPNVK